MRDCFFYYQHKNRNCVCVFVSLTMNKANYVLSFLVFIITFFYRHRKHRCNELCETDNDENGVFGNLLLLLR